MTTIEIRLRNPELYKALCEEFDPDDYVEADEAHDYNEWARLWGPDGEFTKRDKRDETS